MRCTAAKWWVPMVLTAIGVGLVCGVVQAESMTDFEDLGLGPDAYFNGSDESGGFTSGGYAFSNAYDPAWGSWAGWAYSSKTAGDVPGWGNQYSAKPGSGVGGSNTYGIAYYSAWPAETIPTVTIPDGRDVPDGTYVTNTAYAYFSMRDGDGFVSAFGPNDWQKLTITGTSGGTAVDAVEFDLAVGTDIVDDWTWLDLSSLQGRSVDALELTFSGSQADMVPSYAAIDAIAEPSTFALLASAVLGATLWRRRRR